MKKIILGLLVLSSLSFSASYDDCRKALYSKGYKIIEEVTRTPDSGGELSMSFRAYKDGVYYSIYVEVSSNGKEIVFDKIKSIIQ